MDIAIHSRKQWVRSNSGDDLSHNHINLRDHGSVFIVQIEVEVSIHLKVVLCDVEVRVFTHLHFPLNRGISWLRLGHLRF